MTTPRPNDDLATLTTLSGEIQATLLADELKRQGIPAEPSGVMTAGFRAEAPGSVKVLVRESDLAEARRMMDDYFSSQKQIDWDQVDVGEREDGPAAEPDAT
jgi:hypothetical protein